MATTIRPEIDRTNPYYISRHRYYELKHYCLQYDEWRKALASLDGMARPSDEHIDGGNTADPTQMTAELRERYTLKIRQLKLLALKADEGLGPYLLEAATRNRSYEWLKLHQNLPCCRNEFYELYRRFFWLLSQARV